MAPPKKKRASRGYLAATAQRALVVWTLLASLLAASLLTRPVWLGLLVLVCALVIFMLLSYYVARRRVFSQSVSRAERIAGWRAFIGWTLGLQRSSFLVESAATMRTVTAGAGLAAGLALVDAHSAVVTHRRGKHHRVLGPGVHVLQGGESIRVGVDGQEPARVREAVDLRRQSRSLQLQAQTLDGLFVKTTLFALFQIDRDADPALDERQFLRFYPDAVHRAVEAERVGAAAEILDWTSLPVSLAQDAALQIISTYTLDELYAPRGNHSSFRPADMRRALGEQISAEIRDALKARGIQLLAAGVSKIEPADVRVTRQRVTNWRATHQRHITALEAQSLAAAETMREEARGKAQSRLLKAILSGMSSARGQSRALLQLRLAAALERMFEVVPGEPLPVESLGSDQPKAGA